MKATAGPKSSSGSEKNKTGKLDALEFSFEAEDGKRVWSVTGVQTCALPISTRSSEIRLATWTELDFEKAIWTIPAERMGKRGVEHVIPLSQAAMDVFDAAKAHRRGGSDFVFQGMKLGKPLSDMTLTKVLRDMEVDATVHGFRSSFKDWAAETTQFANEVSEAARHHAIGNKSEAAYRRGNLLDKRRNLMEVWGGYCGGTVVGNVVRMAR